jgi:hypothetical protein
MGRRTHMNQLLRLPSLIMGTNDRTLGYVEPTIGLSHVPQS